MNNLTRIYTESPMLQAVVSTVVIYGGLAEGVSGAELRDWLVSESEPVEDANGTLESDTADSDARIAELTRQRDAAVEAYGELERSIAERYIELPVDADGMPIHVGDVVEFGENHNQGIVKALNEHMVIAMHVDDGCMNYAKYGLLWNADACRHVKPRTIEDVLDEYYDSRGWDEADNCALKSEELTAKYADEIRGMMEVD